MKRAIPLFVLLVTVLSVLLYLKLRQQRLEAERPSGGSATIEGTRIDVVSRLPGRLRVVSVQAGDRVQDKQVLAELECSEQRAMLAQADAGLEGARIGLLAAQAGERLAKEGIRGASSQVAMAKAAADAAKAQKEATEVQRGAADRASKRVQEVHQAGAVSDQTLDQSETQLLGLDHQLSALGSSLESALARTISASSAKQAAVIQTELAGAEIHGAEEKLAAAQAVRDAAATAVSECTLLAPRDAIVQDRNFEQGEVVMPGSRVLTLVDIREVKATFYLPNAELGAAKTGAEVELRADTYGNQVFHGHISHVGVEAEFTPRNVQTREDRDRLVYAVEATVPNPEGLLRPGMPVEIVIPGTGKGAR